jgi:hypothetical protein
LKKNFKFYWPAKREYHMKVADIPADKIPYRRILVWKARHNAIRNLDLNLLNPSNLCENANASTADDVHNNNNDDDDYNDNADDADNNVNVDERTTSKKC